MIDMAAAPQPQNAVVREEFSAMQTQQNPATAEGAIAAQYQAATQARYVMALRRPRDWLQVRALLLKDCRRLRFAQSAQYAKPIGGDKCASGLSIRFAEAVLRAAGNVAPEVSILYDDPAKRLIRVQVSDLEANVTYSQDFIIEKTVERSFLAKGQRPISQRVNSQGKTTYLVAANAGELLNKEAAQVSKTLRNLVLRLLPGDIADDCRDVIEKTIASGDQADPQAAIKAVVDGFMLLNVQPESLSLFLGHDVAQASPAQIAELRKFYMAVREGEVTWADLLDSRRGTQADDDAQADPSHENSGSRSKQLARRIKTKAIAATKPAPLTATAHAENDEEDPDQDTEGYQQRAAKMAARDAAQEE